MSKRVFLVVLTVVAMMASFAATGRRASAASNGHVAAINNSDRAQVARTYLESVVNTAKVPHHWTGSADGCSAGSTSAEFTAATIETVNWFRRMAGLQPVIEDPAASDAAQAAALMMHAQNGLSHYPTPAWDCHTASGARAAGLSNLTLGVAGPRGVVGQIEDPGAGNEALGHRRWLLYPGLESIGVGNTSTASAVQVIGSFGARAAESEWVTWPPAGFVPDAVVFDRWSISASNPSADFTNASVSVTENGRSVGVQVYPTVNGFGDPTLAFEVVGINPDAAGDVTYTVEVDNVRIDGRLRSHTYTVRSFDPTSTAAPVHRCKGEVATIVGTAGNDTLRGTPGKDVIVGLGGNDTIIGLGGADIICGGKGHDTIRGGWGNDTIIGGPGRDRLNGNQGRDYIHGGQGRDILSGGAGVDLLIGGRHIDQLLGNGGVDTCWGHSSNQSLATSDDHSCERGR